jgi:pheromone shutdown protein TraB
LQFHWLGVSCKARAINSVCYFFGEFSRPLCRNTWDAMKMERQYNTMEYITMAIFKLQYNVPTWRENQVSLEMLLAWCIFNCLLSVQRIKRLIKSIIRLVITVFILNWRSWKNKLETTGLFEFWFWITNCSYFVEWRKCLKYRRKSSY